MASVRSLAQQSTGGTQYTVPGPAGAAAGDLALMFCTLHNSTTAADLTFPAGWTVLASNTDGTSMSLIASHRFGSADPPFVMTVAGGSALSIAWYAIRDAGAPAVSAVATAFNVNPDSLPVTIPGSPGGTSLFLSFAGITDAGGGIVISAYPTNYNNNTANPIGGGSGLAVGTRQLGAATDDPGPFTQTNVNAWLAWTVGVPDSASGSFVGEPGGGIW